MNECQGPTDFFTRVQIRGCVVYSKFSINLVHPFVPCGSLQKNICNIFEAWLEHYWLTNYQIKTDHCNQPSKHKNEPEIKTLMLPPPNLSEDSGPVTLEKRESSICLPKMLYVLDTE